MIHTAVFRQQHEEIKVLVEQISSRLDAEQLGKDAEEVRSLVSRLVGKLNVHLAMEDNVLYERLSKSSNAELQALGISFQEKIGGLKDALKSFQTTWPTPASVSEKPESFVTDAKEFIEALLKRVQLEDEELFAEIEKAS
ncbi:MAG: hemerythrin domain-containing protein [Desulfuromonadales bacterium]|nr:hemerythrin domain-containing protein [Desulfuromonadales bacterium]